MRIVDVRETTVPLQSELSNATMSFRSMTVSVLALVSDQVRDGEPVIGYGFNSIGRYAQGGLLRERLIPRLLAADPGTLVGEHGDIDPQLIWQAAMRDEKPGGHGDRAVAMGVLDMAAWDLAGKLAGAPLHRLLGERLRDSRIPDAPLDRVWVYAAGGYYHPQGGTGALQDEVRSYLDLGYRTVKMKIGGAPLAEDLRRIEPCSTCCPRAAISPSTPTAASISTRRWPTPTPCRPSRCAGSRRPVTRSTTSRWPGWPSATRARWPPART